MNNSCDARAWRKSNKEMNPSKSSDCNHQILTIDQEIDEKTVPAASEENKTDQCLISNRNEVHEIDIPADDMLSQSFTETIKKTFDDVTKTLFRSNSEIDLAHTKSLKAHNSMNRKDFVLKLAEKKIHELGIEVNDKVRENLLGAIEEPADNENLNQSYQKAVNAVVERHFSKLNDNSQAQTLLKRQTSLTLAVKTPELKIKKTFSTPAKFDTPEFQFSKDSIEHAVAFNRSGLFEGENGIVGSKISNILEEIRPAIVEGLEQTFDPDDSLANIDPGFFSNHKNPLKKIVVFADSITEKAEELERIRREKEEELLYPSCLICFQAIIPKRQCKISPCEHQLCSPCIVQYVKELIKSNKVLKIPCPTGECKKPWDDKAIESMLTPEEFKRYTKLKQIAIVNADPSLRWCIKPGCERYNKGNAANPHIVCSCGTEICFNCSLRWHPKITCEKAMEAEYKNYANQKEVQFCPSCKSRCEKDSGCNHMTCSLCTYQWCWLCRGAYSTTHYSPLNPLGCPGLQSGSHTRKKWNFFKRHLVRLLLLIFWIIVIAISPVILVIVGIGIPWFFYHDRARHNYRWRKKSSCEKFGTFCFFVLLGIVLLPVLAAAMAILLVVPGTCFLAYLVGSKIQRDLRSRRLRLRAIAEIRRRAAQR